MSPYNCIIIGAGWSGAVAARSLAARGHHVLVLEARDQIGGRARTHTEGMHAPVDLGCSFIHGYREGNPAKEIAQEFHIASHLTQQTESAIFDGTEQLSRDNSDKLRMSLSSALSDAANQANYTPRLASDVSLASFLASLSPSPSVHPLARTLEVPYGIPLEEVALRWHGWADSFAGSDATPAGGFQPLVEAVFARAQVHGAELRLKTPVVLLEQVASGVCVETDSGTKFMATTVICTTPLGVLQAPKGHTLFKPALPLRRQEVIKRTRVGVLEKLVLAYPSAWWPGADSIGSFTFLPTKNSAGEGAASNPAEEVKRALDKHTISVASFAAPTLLKSQHPTLLFYLSPGPALALSNFSPEDLARGAHAFLVARFGLGAELEPTSSIMTSWHKDEYARGATSSPCVVGPDVSPLDFVELGKPLWGSALCFAGEHTDVDHRGSITGAIKSGLREAERVHLFLSQKDT